MTGDAGSGLLRSTFGIGALGSGLGSLAGLHASAAT
jgi:hypothetical protein